ncbi:sphingomyelin synthase-related protein 1-like [Ptychodera flava]|uniref:sphingomyelin synthase-related protein 1-like n=1 Tax=Ptychodera flava TaxID=63121 RepID=UPI00396A42AD
MDGGDMNHDEDTRNSRSKSWNSIGSQDAIVSIDEDTTEQSHFINGHPNNDSPTIIEPERCKTVISFLYMCVGTYFLTFVLTVVHDRMPDTEKHPPLPDIVLDNVPLTPWAGEISEGILTTLGVMFFIIVFLHQHRFIVLRRFFCITATLYLLRSATIFVTSLPETGQHIDCSADFTGSVWSRLWKSFQIFIKLGMASTGGRTCGAYLYSGHAMVMTNLTFFITEYSPRSFWMLHLIIWMMSVTGMFCILAAHGHYTVDVVIAFYVTTRMFIYYHSLSSNRVTRNRYKRWQLWFPLIRFFENNMDGVLPNEYGWPFPRPLRISRLFQNNS